MESATFWGDPFDRPDGYVPTLTVAKYFYEETPPPPDELWQRYQRLITYVKVPVPPPPADEEAKDARLDGWELIGHVRIDDD